MNKRRSDAWTSRPLSKEGNCTQLTTADELTEDRSYHRARDFFDALTIILDTTDLPNVSFPSAHPHLSIKFSCVAFISQISYQVSESFISILNVLLKIANVNPKLCVVVS